MEKIMLILESPTVKAQHAPCAHLSSSNTNDVWKHVHHPFRVSIHLSQICISHGSFAFYATRLIVLAQHNKPAFSCAL